MGLTVWHGRLVAACCLAMTLLGCSYDYNKQTAAMHSPYEAGDFARAAAVANELNEKVAKHDQVIYRLEQGAILRAAGDLQASTDAFDKADQIISEYEQQADVRISQEFSAAMVNQAVMEYRGYAYDRIMMNTYKALNCLETGDRERARVELRRAYQRQRDAVDKYAKRIEAARKEREKQKQARQTMDSEQFRGVLKQHYADLEAEDFSAYADYVNPFTEYIQGLFLMYAAADSSDLEQAATAMRRAAGMARDNDFVQQDMALAEKLANGSLAEPITYVLAETGLAPQRKEIVIHLPLFIASDRVDYVGFAFPKLVKRSDGCEQMLIQTSSGSYQTAVLCDMDKVIGQEFKNELALVITREVLSAIAKAAAAYGVNEATRNDQTINAITRISATLYQVATNHADLRTWKSLPKRFCVARFATPADRRITVSLAGGGWPQTVQLEDGIVNVVYVKCVSPARPPAIRQFKLK